MIKIKAPLEVRPVNSIVGYLSQVLYTAPDGSEDYHASVVDHIGSNDTYYLKGMFTGYTREMPIFLEYVIVHEDKCVSVKYNDWYKLIKGGYKAGDILEWTINPLKFVEGDYMKECTLCNSHFQANKRQPICEGCCNENAIATFTKEKKKAKKPILITPDFAMEIAEVAYHAGNNDESWEFISGIIKKQIENGGNRTTDSKETGV